MALRVPQPPAESLAVAGDALRVLADQGRFRSTSLLEVPAAELELTRPLQVYTLGLDDLRAARTLDAAVPAAWRYLVQHGTETVGLAETVPEPDGAHTFAQMNYGPFAAGTADAFQAAEDTGTDADVRLLHIPALHLIALWLHREGADDSLVPVAPAPDGIEPNREIPATVLLTRLTNQAQAIPETGPDDVTGS